MARIVTTTVLTLMLSAAIAQQDNNKQSIENNQDNANYRVQDGRIFLGFLSQLAALFQSQNSSESSYRPPLFNSFWSYGQRQNDSTGATTTTTVRSANLNNAGVS